MTPLIPHFDLLATAPGGVARLRELILTLAVQGKLVPQEAGDEPAGVLLQRIRSSRKLPPKSNSAAAITDSFDLPAGWTRAPIGELSELITSGSRDWARHYSDRGAIFVRMGNLSRDSYRLRMDNVQYVQPPNDGEGKRTALQANDLLVSITGEVGWLGLIPEGFGEAYVNQHVCLIRWFEELRGEFLPIQLLSRYARDQFNEPQRGIKNSFRLKDVENLVVVVPPLKEQSRIVTRVEELMHLCDALEQQRQLETAQHAQLLNTLLGTLTDCTSPDELAANWQRVSDHFDLLLDRPEAVDALEQTILQLAVRGLLVPQDPADEPASVLLQRIKRVKPLPALATGETPFDLPSGWQWVRFDELINPLKPVSYGVLVPGPEVPGGVPFVRIADLSITRPAAQPEKSISPEISAQYQRTQLEGGEILMGVVGSIGKLGVAPKSWAGANIARAVCRIVPVSEVRTEFILLLLESEFMQKNFSGDTRTLAQPTLNVGLIRSAPTPLPPLAEQTRIVARVTQLRDLCTTLRQRLTAGQTTQRHLAEALVDV